MHLVQKILKDITQSFRAEYSLWIGKSCSKAKQEEILVPKTVNVPRELQKSFYRLIDLIPVPFKYEEQVQKDILLFLKLEGEEYVRTKIERSKEFLSKKAEDNSVEGKDEI
jgi:hypothetical protein